MALAIDSQEVSNAGHHATTSTSPGTLSWSFTNSAGTLLIVGVVCSQVNSGTGSNTTTGVTYGGTALTKSGSISWGSSSNGSSIQEASLWYLNSPTTSANTVQVTSTFTNFSTVTGSPDIIGGAISFTGADGTTPLGTSVTAKNDSAGSSSASVTVASTTSGNYTVAVIGTGSGYSSTSNTRTWSLNVSTFSGGDNSAMTDQSVSGASTTMTDTITSDWWGIVGVEVKAGTGGGGYDPSAQRIGDGYGVTNAGFLLQTLNIGGF